MYMAIFLNLTSAPAWMTTGGWAEALPRRAGVDVGGEAEVEVEAGVEEMGRAELSGRGVQGVGPGLGGWPDV